MPKKTQAILNLLPPQNVFFGGKNWVVVNSRLFFVYWNYKFNKKTNMDDKNYINIQGWMINQLGLKGNELILYAIIYGFSQDGESEYFGSQRYIAKAMKISLPTANSLINKLLTKGYIEKVKESHYKTVKETLTPKKVKKTLTPVLKKVEHKCSRNLNKTVKETLTNNNTINKLNNKTIDKQKNKKEIAISKSKEIIKDLEKTPAQKARDFFGNENLQKATAMKISEKNGKMYHEVLQEIESFIDYWTEPTKSGKKELWETKPTFDVKRRLQRWFRNKKQWSNNNHREMGFVD